MDKKAIRGVKKFKRELMKHFPIDAMVFFGSRTGRNFHEDSDIDLIIVSNRFNGVSFFKRVAKMYDYWKLRYPVDFICYTPKEFEELKSQISIVSEALRDGIKI